MAGFSNQFSWSFSRHKTFASCRRQYFHQYYGYWNGWSPDGPDRACLTYRLKNIVTMPMWAGDIVHRIVERIIADLRNRETNTLEKYQEQARRMLNQEWAESLEKAWRWKPKYKRNLFEHYYEIEVSSEERVALRDKIYRCLRNFMHSETFDRLGNLLPQDWRSVEQLEQFTVGDIPVFVKIDCAVSSGETLVLYDWKTGRETEDTMMQLGCYGLYAFQTWRVPLEQQRLVSFYLDSDVVHEAMVSAEQIIETKDMILASAAAMRELLDSPARENRASEENFPMTENRSLCVRCVFREVCYGSREESAIAPE